ncbi:MAG: cytochrome c biogenesis protein CcdA [Desulfobacterium sp.]|nr:cytochrome c biogenesis protein CcdA [Desulfobacterium sp.]
MFTETITFQAAFMAGLLSFFSPCILPLIPAYFTFITGLSLDELSLDNREIRKKVMLSTLAYVSGFSFVFILLGASASFLGSFMAEYTWLIRYLGGAIVIIFGLHLLGVINIKELNFERKIHLNQKPVHLMGTFVIGMAFGAGWSPCIGPLLGSILIVAGSQDTVVKGMVLLGIYSAGLAIPFILISLFINRLLDIMRRATRVISYINKISGILLIVLGILLITDRFRILAGL